ncbi:methionine gamma-lyase [Anaerococcus porci]|uniref:methionine gamma-lyase n=1 Tax=Anaerococcus porci TaxID=2652269 RepID=UPI002A74F348|nr:methionine gamma-lyase [Anaerococcus porci]MDY3006543.1 methionine gamma-lyase [Anaerococcus porci]
MTDIKKERGFATNTIHKGSYKDGFGSLGLPIYQTSTFIFDNAEQGGRRFALEEGGYIYSRLGNPTNNALEEKLAALEGAEAAVSTSSGMGAITSSIWPFIKAGDHILACKTLYGCTFAFLNEIKKFNVDVDFIDMTDINELKKSVKDNTRIIYLETPANPTLDIIDIEAVANLAKQNSSDTLVIVDNTFATPYLQNPLKLGADIVVHSATKYLNGHGDVVAGFSAGSKELMTQVRFVGQKDFTGSVLSAHDAFLIFRGMKTLEVRMKKHVENAKKIVEALKGNKNIEKIYYPGLSDFKNHDIAKKQMKDFGAMIAFEVKGGIESGRIVMNNVKLCSLAVSLGDCETLIEHPASMTHSTYTEEALKEAGIAPGLIRLSVGLEDSEDIIEDLLQALDKIK